MATKKTVSKPASKAEAKPVAKKASAAKAAPAKKASPAKSAAKAAPAKKAVAKDEGVLFAVRAEVGSKVFLAGSFNGWDPIAQPMTDKAGDGLYACTVSLAKGKHEYKFVINGVWCADPENPEWVPNEMGTLNSVKIVK